LTEDELKLIGKWQIEEVSDDNNSSRNSTKCRSSKDNIIQFFSDNTFTKRSHYPAFYKVPSAAGACTNFYTCRSASDNLWTIQGNKLTSKWSTTRNNLVSGPITDNFEEIFTIVELTDTHLILTGRSSANGPDEFSHAIYTYKKKEYQDWPHEKIIEFCPDAVY